MPRHSVLMLAMLCMVGTPALAKDHPLTASEIRQRLTGKTITDGTHWAYTLNADGKVSAMDMGKPRSGTWRISVGELCIRVPAKADEDCWAVRQRGSQLFLSKGEGFSVEISVEEAVPQ